MSDRQPRPGEASLRVEPAGQARVLLRRVRFRLGTARARLLRPEPTIPIAARPDAAALLGFPGEDELVPALRDGEILRRALAWRDRATPDAGAAPALRRGVAPGRAGAGRRRIANVVLVSHCDFTGNSALHVLAVASELHRRGLAPLIAVPDLVDTVDDVGRPPFPVVSYEQARTGTLRFPDGGSPDLVHAFTPREHVRTLVVDLVRRYGCPYVVHLEDNEEAILSAELGGVDMERLASLPAPLLDPIVGARQSHPLRASQLLDCAAGITVVIERLLEVVPEHVPAAVVRAGFDEAMLAAGARRAELRAELGLADSDLAIVYPGNVHRTNLDDMRSLYAAIRELRRDGHPAVLVKTGWDSPEASRLPRLGAGIRELGWVPRVLVPELIGAADVLVQPGSPGPFNDFRFPSKLPEFLASGRPVVLPRTNVGLELRDGEEAVVLERGETQEIVSAVERLAADPALAERIGGRGRAFAERRLRWGGSVDAVEELYGRIAVENRPAAPAWALERVDPPLRLIAVVRGTPTPEAARSARAHGIHAFCVPAEAILRSPGLAPCFRYCLRLGSDDPALLGSLATAVLDPRYVRVDGAALLLADATASPERCRQAIDAETGLRSHVVVWEGENVSDLANAVVEPLDGEGAWARVARELPEHRLYRSAIYPEGEPLDVPAQLRKLVLETLARAPLHEPLVFLGAEEAWADPARRAALLAATATGLRDGIRQFYASQRLALSADEVERAFLGDEERPEGLG